ncbi:MAG: type III pantothenate kinase [Victivallales bacterium]|nr:type III pantothenate kinase [Victivallales bacterium]
MHFLLNIGNTRTAVLDNAHLTEKPPPIHYYATERFVEEWRPQGGDWFATAACVVPAVREALEHSWTGRISFVDAGSFPEVDFSAYGSGLGADRMANAAAAHALNRSGASLVIDCGTALNTVAVDAAGKFRGGVILPGRQTALAALGRQTAQLPEFTATAAEKSINPLGLSTEEGIRNGVDFTLLAAVERIIRETRHRPGFARCRVWLTGGDAPFYLQNLPRSLAAAEAPLPLTLMGVALAHCNGNATPQ